MSNTNDLAAATSFPAIVFKDTTSLDPSGCGAFTIAGNSITLTSGIVNKASEHNLQTISLAIILTGTRTIAAINGAITLSGVLSGASGALTTTGPYGITLTGANTYAGTTTISSGTLKINAAAFSTAPRTYSISSGGTLNIDGNTGVAIGTTTINGTGTLYVTGGNLYNSVASGRNITMSLGSGGLIDVESGATLTNGGFSNITWTSNLADLNVDGTFDVWDGNDVTVDALTGGGTITKGWTSAGVLITVGADNGSGTFSGVINNTYPISLTKTGSGTQTLTGANTYTGATTISAGTLLIKNTSGSGTGTGAVTANAGTLGGTGTISGTVTMNSGSTLAPGTVNKQLSTGNLTLNSGSTFSVLFNGPTHANTDRVNVTGTVDPGSANLSISVGYVPSLGDKDTIIVNDGADGMVSSHTFNGLPEGASISAGGYNFIISYVGGTGNDVVLTCAGTYWWDNSTSAGYQAVTGTWGTNNYWTTNGTTLVAWPGTSTPGFSAVFDGNNGPYQVTVSGTQDVDSIAFNYSFVKIKSGTLNFGTQNGILVASGQYDTISTVITGTGGNTKYGAGNLILAGTNTYTGVTTVAQGTLKLGASGTLPSATAVTMGQSGNYTATLDLNAFNQTIAGLTEASGNTGGANALTVTNSGAAATLTISNSGNYTYDSLISGAIALTKTGSGTQTLANVDNTYTGITTITGGILSVGTLAAGGAASGIGQASNVAASLVIDGGTLQYTGGAVSIDRLFTIGATNNSATIDASGSAALKLTNTGTMGRAGTTARTLTLTGSCTGWDSLAALISDNTGATSLVKSGAGTWVLSAANTYTGATTISNGGLYVTNATTVGAGGTGNGGAVTVNSGGTLGGYGEVRGAVTVNSGATLNPGTTGLGSLKIVGDLTFTTGSYLNITLNGTANDTIFDTGAVSLGNVTLNLTLGCTPTIGQVFKVIDNDGTDGVTGTFNGLVEGAKFSSGGYRFQVSYAGGTGNDVILTVVPTGIDDYSTWLYSKPVYLNTTTGGANVVTNQDSFPVLVRLSSTTFNFSQARDSGQDIRFSKSDGATHIPYQIDSWSKANKTASIWVRPDTVYGRNSTQYFIMYWGNSAAGDSSSGSNVFPTSKGFKGVWHFNNAGTGKRPDATANNDSAKCKGATFTSNGGNIAGCDTFIASSSQYDSVASGISLSGSSFTVSAWAKMAVAPTADEYIASQGNGSTDQALHFGYNNTAGKYTFRFFNDDLDQYAGYTGGTAWHYIAGTFNTTGKVQTLYYDGAYDNSRTATGNYSGTGALGIGAIVWSTGNQNYWNGNIDEVVVSNVVRPPDWIKLCYQNQQQNQTLVDLDDYTQWQYSQNINLNTTPGGADVDTTLSNFPILVRLTSSNFTFSQAQDSGHDIRFSKSNGAHIPFEVERWDRVDQLAEIWVKMDTVYGNNGTQYFTMYWGNSSASSKSSGAGVFDTAYGFRGVWHLNTSGTGARPDATVNGYTATANSYGAGTFRSLGGNIGGADSLDGSTQFLSLAAGQSNWGNGLTFSCWAFPTSTGTYARFIDFGNGAPGDNIIFSRSSTTQQLNEAQNNGTNYGGNLVEPGASIVNNQWGYYAFTANGTAVKMYSNGSQVYSGTSAQSIPNVSRANNYFGKSAWGTDAFYMGGLDEIVLSWVVRTGKWLKLCYQNQRSDQVLVDLEDYSTWGFSKNITMNTSGLGLSGNVTRFPYLVRLDNTNFNFNQPQVHGEDIRFSRADGTHFPYQIERWDNGNKLAEIWVLIDTVLQSSSTQYFKMYWGKNDVASKSSGTSVFNTANGFVGVWHLNDVNITTGYDDATVNNLNATGHNMAVTDTVTAVIAKGQTFNGSNKYLSIGSGINLVNSRITLSAWAQRTNTSAGQWILSQGTAANNSCLQFDFNASNYFSLGFYNNDLASSATNTTTTWHYWAATFDTTGKAQSLYLDGAPNNSRTSTAYYGGSGELDIGRYLPSTNGYFNGYLNEVRVEDTARSADWIKLCYNNQMQASSISPSDSSDAFRPLSIKRFNGGADSIYVYNTRWAIKFNGIKGGGGIKFLGPDTVIGHNQLDTGLFCVRYNGHESDTGAGTISMLDSSPVFTRIRQVKSVAGQPFTIDYTVLGSGRVYARVTTLGTATTASTAGLAFRIKNASTTHYKNIQYGATPSGCQAVMRVDSTSGNYDILMAPFDLWGQADQVNKGPKYIEIGSTSWSLAVNSRQTWNFMIDISHKTLHDSAAAWKYINDYATSDTLGWFTGTPLLEKSWEDLLMGHWKLNEKGGDTAGDASATTSGLGNFGSIRGGGKWTAGMWGNGDSLDNTDSIIVHPGTPSSFYGGTSGRGFTILGWVKPTVALSASSVLFQQIVGNSGYQLIGGSSGQLLLTVGNGTTLKQLQGVTALSIGQWFHVGAEMTWARDTLKLYVNGNLDTILVSAPMTGYPAAGPDSLDMGKSFTGVLDDMRFYGEYLSDQQVKAVYLKGFSPDLGMYSARADNNNQIQCTMHGDYTSRILPVFQIANYWAGNDGPTKVYVDSMPLTSGTDYWASVDQARKVATVGLNWSVTSNSTVYIGNNAIGQSMLDTMPRMYWGQATVGTGCPHVWVKNFSGNYFGPSTAGNFFFDWKMTYNSATTTKNGEMWFFGSSFNNANARLDTTANVNSVPGYDVGYSNTFGQICFELKNSNYPTSQKDVDSAFTYSIAESSSVRVLLNLNTRKVKLGTDSFHVDTRWAIYPTGQIWRWDSVSYIDGPVQKMFYGYYLDSLNLPTAILPSPHSRLRGGLHSTTVPDFVTAKTRFCNSGGVVAQPWAGAGALDTIDGVADHGRVGVEFNDQVSNPNTIWGSSLPDRVTSYVDLQRTTVTTGYVDSIGCSVQHFPSPAAIILNSIGTLQNSTWGDLNGDGFSEGEGAYVITASNNSVDLEVYAAAADTSCRYNPAFRITSYTGATEPQYVIVGPHGGAQTLLTPAYGYNVYLNKAAQQVVIQLNQTFCVNTDVYISYDKTLAVTTDRFDAQGGDRNDTLVWRTESEDQNMGFSLYRRVKPSFMDSLLGRATGPNADTTDNAVACVRKKLVTQQDTGWQLVNTNGLISGAPQGKSYGPRNYRYVDYRVFNDIQYEYSLEAIDFKNLRSLYKDYADAMPKRILPKVFELSGNFPNPFRAMTMIRFALPTKTKVDLYVYNLEGRLVRKLVNHEQRDEGFYKIGWDGKDDLSRTVASGPYIYRMTTPSFVKSRIMILAR